MGGQIIWQLLKNFNAICFFFFPWQQSNKSLREFRDTLQNSVYLSHPPLGLSALGCIA